MSEKNKANLPTSLEKEPSFLYRILGSPALHFAYLSFTLLWLFFLCPNLAAKSLSIEQLKRLHPSHYFVDLQLQSGHTNVQTLSSGPPVIFIHGVSGPAAVWDKNIKVIASEGYQTIRYDLIGRGFSIRLDEGHYDLNLFVEQLEELIFALNIDSRIRIVGSSFGSIIATEYALRHPDRVAGLILIGPAGFSIQVPWTAKLRNLPLVGQVLSYFLAQSTIMRQNDLYFVRGQMPEPLRSYVADQLSVRGTTSAILKTLEHSPVQSYLDSYRRLAKTNIPVGVIWGRQDQTFPFENAAALAKAATQSNLVVVEDSAHLPQYEKSDEVNGALTRFLKIFEMSK